MNDLRYIPHVATVMSGIMCAEAIADGCPVFATPLPYCIIATAAVELIIRIKAKKKVMLARQRNMTAKENIPTLNYITGAGALSSPGKELR